MILFYKYVGIRRPETVQKQQYALCRRFHLRGRIIVATEGINGTLEGTAHAIQRYIMHTKEDARFASIVFKRSSGTGDAFPKLSIKVRDEIVTLGVPVKNRKPGTYVQPAKLRSWIHKKEDMTILDVRNGYETAVGRFEHSLTPRINNFRDVPNVAHNLESFKNKKLVMVCTGGIRCEKASRYFKQQGYKQIYQLEGGIATYMKKYGGEDFVGSLYVFDNRILIRGEKGKHTVVGRCAACGEFSERYTNCAYDPCHAHFICCETCEKEQEGYCSKGCKGRADEILKFSEKARMVGV